MKHQDLYREWIEYLRKTYDIPWDVDVKKASIEFKSIRDEYSGKVENSQLWNDILSAQERIEYKEYFRRYMKVVTFEEYKYARTWDYNYLINHVHIQIREFRRQEYGTKCI